MKELSFEKAYVISFQESIDVKGAKPMQMDFTISAEKIKIGNAEHKNEWPAQSWIPLYTLKTCDVKLLPLICCVRI